MLYGMLDSDTLVSPTFVDTRLNARLNCRRLYAESRLRVVETDDVVDIGVDVSERSPSSFCIFTLKCFEKFSQSCVHLSAALATAP